MSYNGRVYRVSGLTICLALLAGCGDDELVIDNLPGGNPLVPEIAMYPFPSSFYLEDDEATVTGKRLALPDEAMPGELSATPFEGIDGFSRVSLITTFIPGGVDPATLPDLTDPGASVSDTSSVWLLHADSHERVPVLVELDANVTDVADQALLIRPQAVLDANTTYVVVVRDGVRLLDGSPARPTDAFVALRDDIATDVPEVESQRGDYARTRAAFEAAGATSEEVVQAWSFHTRSNEQVHAPLLSMQDAAMDHALSFVIESDEVDGDNRLVEGTFSAPDFLGDDDLVQIEEGAAVPRGTRDVPFLLTIPVTASQQERPVIVYGHGFLSRMEETTWSQLNGHLQGWRMAAISTEFIGFTEDDTVATLDVLTGNLDQAFKIVSQQMQSEIHFTLLARLVEEELASVVLSDTDAPILDADAVHFMGISNGGTQGMTIVASSPMFERAALVVPGGAWMHMLQRAVQFNLFGPLLTSQFAQTRELQLALSLLQLHFDHIDGASWIQHMTDNRLPGRDQIDVRATLHEAVGDAQVANMITEWMARSANIPLITPSPRDVWGIPTLDATAVASADPSAALIIYDEGYPPLSPGNVPPATDNGSHETIRDLSVYQQHIGEFLENGTIQQVCEGACDPE